MPSIREFAPAKINLTLEVIGRLSNGYHQLDSLVAFADVGDVVTLDPGEPVSVTVGGPMANGLSGHHNILETVFSALREEQPGFMLGAVHLEKHLPIAAGIGGGSADAAALLRAVRRGNATRPGLSADWQMLAASLGADVPVCLEGRPSWITGVHQGVGEIEGGVPPLAAVLVNPMAGVPRDKTAQVFRALGAPRTQVSIADTKAPSFADREALLGFMRARGNQLAAAAQTVVPEIARVMAVLGATPGVEHAAVSGAGPTCFGIFPDRAAAEAARERIAAREPAWWAVAVTLGSSPPPAATRTS